MLKTPYFIIRCKLQFRYCFAVCLAVAGTQSKPGSPAADHEK